MKLVKCICKQCGKEVERYPSIAKTFKFCSKECKGLFKRVDKVRCICQLCGSDFEVYPSVVNNGGGHFCSKECEWENLRNIKIKPKVQCICKQCGTEIYTTPSEAKTFKFCSIKCKGDYQKQFIGDKHKDYKKLTVNCDFCGNPITRAPSLLSGKKMHFCNYECMGKWRSINLIGANSAVYKDKIKCECKQCKSIFYRHESQIDNGVGIFCSTKCHGEWKSQNIIGVNNHRYLERISTHCDYCKSEIILEQYRVNKGGRHFCSKECQFKYKSEVLIGTMSPNWSRIKQTCLNCNKEFDAIKSQVEYGYAKYCSRDCFGEHNVKLGVFKGDKNPNWRDGGSESVYCEKFNKEFRRRVRAFFDHTCLLCGKSQTELDNLLGVHHVYYKKSACCENYDDEGNRYVIIHEKGKKINFYINGDPNKFAPLCPECHGKTNGNRVKWAQILEGKINNEYGGKSYYTKEEYRELTQ